MQTNNSSDKYCIGLAPVFATYLNQRVVCGTDSIDSKRSTKGATCLKLAKPIPARRWCFPQHSALGSCTVPHGLPPALPAAGPPAPPCAGLQLSAAIRLPCCCCHHQQKPQDLNQQSKGLDQDICCELQHQVTVSRHMFFPIMHRYLSVCRHERTNRMITIWLFACGHALAASR